MNETGNTAYISAETVPLAHSHLQGGADAIDQVAAAINFALAAVEHDCLVSELTTGEIKELACAAIAAMPVWQPIDTAPKDVQVLICGQAYLGHYNAVAKLTDRIWFLFDPAMDDFTVESSGHSHWMPLPASPTSLSDGEVSIKDQYVAMRKQMAEEGK